MEIEMILSLISPDLLILVVVLYCIGMFLKQSQVPDYFIPLILLGLGVGGCVIYSVFVLGLGLTAGSIVVAIIQGILCSSLCVFGNQLVKQLLEKSYWDRFK